MHVLQSKHSRLKLEEAEELLKKLNLSRAQLPKIKITDAALPEGAQVGEVIKIERADGKQKKEYFRIVV
jgi:DNA-directed RNA polymerase subunit H